MLRVVDKKRVITLLPHIVEVSLVTAAILILGRQFSGEDGAILEYFIVVARRCQVCRIKVGIAVMELDARQLVFVEMNVNSGRLKRWIGDDDEKFLNDVSSCRALLTDEALVNHRLEFVQHLIVFALLEFLFLLSQTSQFSLNFLYSAFKFGGSKSFVWHKSSPFSLR